MASSIARPRRPAAVGHAANRKAWVRAWVLQMPRPQKRQTPSAVAPHTQQRTFSLFLPAPTDSGNLREAALSLARAKTPRAARVHGWRPCRSRRPLSRAAYGDHGDAPRAPTAGSGHAPASLLPARRA